MTKTLFEIVSRVMNIPIEKISDSSGPDSIPEWDSFNMFVLLAEILLLLQGYSTKYRGE